MLSVAVGCSSVLLCSTRASGAAVIGDNIVMASSSCGRRGSGGAVAVLRMMIPSWPAGSVLVAALAVVIALWRTRGSVSVPWVVAGGLRACRGSGGAIARLRSGGSVPCCDGYLGVTTVSLWVVL